MSGLELMKKYKLPQNIKVTVKVTNEGIFFASFPDYPGCITEAKDMLDLISNITDVILTYFDVPRKEAQKLSCFYLPHKLFTKKKEQINKLVNAQKEGKTSDNLALRFNYFTSSIYSYGVNSNLR